MNPAAKSDTARTYESRAKSGLEDYFEWSANPTAFKFTRRDPSPAKEGKEAPDRKSARQAAPSPSEAAPTSLPRQNETRNVPLSDDRSFMFVLPAGGLTVPEVKKISLHLLTLANDFNIDTPDHARMFQQGLTTTN